MRKILIVDDSSILRRMVLESLRRLGDVSFEQAATGLEAIERIALDHYDLMTLDLNMPDMHGLDVLQFIRTQALQGKLPVIVLTTKGDDESRRTALAAGATRYLTKPFTPDVILNVVRELMSQEKSVA